MTINKDKPETIGQARRFNTVRNQYAALGFCDHCAAQEAFARQLGRKRTDPPCVVCAALLDPRVDQPSSPEKRDSARVSALGGPGTPKVAQVRAIGEPETPKLVARVAA